MGIGAPLCDANRTARIPILAAQAILYPNTFDSSLNPCAPEPALILSKGLASEIPDNTIPTAPHSTQCGSSVSIGPNVARLTSFLPSTNSMSPRPRW